MDGEAEMGMYILKGVGKIWVTYESRLKKGDGYEVELSYGVRGELSYGDGCAWKKGYGYGAFNGDGCVYRIFKWKGEGIERGDGNGDVTGKGKNVNE